MEGMNEEEKDTGLRASGRDKLGSYIEDNQTESLETFEDYLGLETDTHSNSSQLSGRKRKHDEVDISSNSNSPLDNSFRVSEGEEEEEEEESNGEDELADLLDM